MIKTALFILRDILRNKMVIIYTLLLFTISWCILGLDNNSSKATLNLLNVILLILPLVTIIFSTIYIYNCTKFIELLLSQPIERKKIWLGLYLGLSIALLLAFIIGCAIPVAIYSDLKIGSSLIVGGLFLTLTFTSLATVTAVQCKDKAKGIALSIFIWILMTVLYDGLLIILMFQFSDFPIDESIVFLSALNPIDLTRINILLQMDISTILGYTGAIFKLYFGTSTGILITFLILFIWIVIPLLWSLNKFNKKDI